MSNRKVEDGPRMNYNITALKVRVVGDNVENPGVFSTTEAIKMAEAMELDLVEISPNADPPVCKIIDYKSLSTNRRKKQRRLKQMPKRLSSKRSALVPIPMSTIFSLS